MRHMIFGALVIVLLLGAGWACAQGQSFAPPAGKTLLFIGQDNDTIKTYMDEVGRMPDGFMLYTSVTEAKSLDVVGDYGAGPGYADELLSKYPGAMLQLGLYMVGASEEVVKGTYDANIEKIGQWIKKAKVPVLLRIGYEFDLPESRYDPQAYQKAYRYIVDKYRAMEIPNVAFVWHSQCSTGFTGSIMDWYPGDDYVDWVAVSIFQTFQIPRAQEIRKLAKEHNKPFMIAESTPSGLWTETGRLDWFTKVFRFINTDDVEAFCYINSNWETMPMFKGQGWGDARVQNSEKVKQVFLDNVTAERYQAK